MNHFSLLGARHNIEVNYLGPDWKEAEALLGTRQVFLPHPRSRALYLVGLHEFGHLISDLARSLFDSDENELEASLACEAAAWGWACKVADRELTGPLQQRDLGYLKGGLGYHAWRIARYGVR
jgi:hypothetical protein